MKSEELDVCESEAATADKSCLFHLLVVGLHAATHCAVFQSDKPVAIVYSEVLVDVNEHLAVLHADGLHQSALQYLQQTVIVDWLNHNLVGNGLRDALDPKMKT